MEAFKINGISHKGLLTVQVPKEFDERELEVIILQQDKNQKIYEEQKKNKHAAKVERLMGMVGSAKNPDFPISRYDVYEQ